MLTLSRSDVEAKISFIEADIFPVIHTIRDTPSNTNGIVDLSSTVNSFLAYPGSINNGHGNDFPVFISNILAVYYFYKNSFSYSWL